MTSLAAKYDYLEKFASKVISSQQPEPRKRAYVPYKGTSSEDGPSKKKKNKQKQTQGSQKNKQPVIKTRQTPDTSIVQKRINTVDQEAPKLKVQKCTTTNPSKTSEEGETPGSEFSARDILRQRLHQKIEESRGLGPIVDPSSEEVKKRRERRKQERERKKRKKKEFRAKKLAEKVAAEAEQEDTPEAQPTPTDKAAQRDTTSVVFSKVEVGEEYVDKVTQKKEKRKQIKGGLTPLTGKNYKQLLTRVQARKAKLEDLREKDPAKAEKEEEKMKWTNMLYKAEGLKIKDNEDMLRASLKKKEQRKAQVKRKWTERSQQVLEKMQNRQDKRRRNLQKRKQGKVEKRKQKARKKGRVLPEDLKKARLD
ncbi:surfeit locus protein 6 [Alosa pseudoharengus]|uniref:surfeit locus protein 6 n=1 Tax=Alosa pseudoharengus TaxID=34774 RepID=UPI003F8BD1C4